MGSDDWHRKLWERLENIKSQRGALENEPCKPGECCVREAKSLRIRFYLELTGKYRVESDLKRRNYLIQS